MNWKYEIHRIISGIGKSPAKNLIEAAADIIRKSKRASSYSQENQFSKSDETAWLNHWIEQNNLWFTTLNTSRNLTLPT